jgi:hypothetical protein
VYCLLQRKIEQEEEMEGGRLLGYKLNITNGFIDKIH